jgi:hypothetical protein
MKTSKLIGIIAVIAIIAFTFTACRPCTHSWSSWTTKTEGTCTTPLVEKRICSVCEREETRNVGEPLEHNIVDGICTICGVLSEYEETRNVEEPLEHDIAGGVLRLYNLPVTFEADTDETDFSYFYEGAWTAISLNNLITGTPKVQITGAGVNRRLTIELDHPKTTAFMPIQNVFPDVIATPSDVNVFFIIRFTESEGFLFCKMLGYLSSTELYYADRDVVLNGYVNSFEYDNVSLKKGWNFVTWSWSSDHKVVASQTQPADTVWTIDWE